MLLPFSGMTNLKSILSVLWLGVALLFTSGCSKTEAKQPPQQALPVNTKTIDLSQVPQTDEYVATIKSRRSATIQPQVDGSLTRILVKSGDHVRAGQVLMTIDPLKQQATVDQQVSTEAQKKAVFDYAQRELDRQQHLFDAGVTSKQNYDQAVQAFDNSKADWEASKAARVTQQRELAYYTLTAPFAGIVGDIPVHIGDYVSPQTLLTTVDENAELEAYIYIPTERSGDIRMGLPVQIVTTTGELIENTQDLLHLAASRQRSAGRSGEGADPRLARPVSHRATGEGARDLEHHAHADGSGAGGDPHRRTAFRLRCHCK